MAMKQLSLFPDIIPDAPGSPEPPAAEAAQGIPADLDSILLGAPLPGQLDLFAQRTLALARIAEVLGAGRVDDAARVLAALRRRFTDDAELRRLAGRIKDLQRLLRAAEAAPPAARPAALLAIVRDIDSTPRWASFRAHLLLRVAAALRDAAGDAAELEGQPPGYYFLQAGALPEARASLEAAVAARRSVRNLVLLADAAFLAGEAAPARRLYLEALLRDPFDPALAGARDDEVAALPELPRSDYDIDEEPAAWAAPTGIVLGVLPRPAAPHDALSEPELPVPPRTPAQREALSRARRFVAALVVASSRDRRGRASDIEARRAMKQLQPALFGAWLARRVSG